MSKRHDLVRSGRRKVPLVEKGKRLEAGKQDKKQFILFKKEIKTLYESFEKGWHRKNKIQY